MTFVDPTPVAVGMKQNPGHRNETLILNFYNCLFASDFEGGMQYLSDDVKVREPECLPYGGIWEGLDCMDVFKSLRTYWGDIVIEHQRLVCTDDNHNFIHFKITGNRPDRSHKLTQHVLEKLTVENGKISEFIVCYSDPSAVADWIAGVGKYA